MITQIGFALATSKIVGGFSDVTGLENEVVYYEYRNGNDKENHVRKIAGISRTGDVTLKRGVIGDLRLFEWLKDTREGVYDPRTVTITLLDESRSSVARWILTKSQPKKWVGPTLSAQGTDGVAMEELVLVAERIDFQSI